MGNALNKLYDKVNNWLEGFIIMLPNIGIAILILVASVFLSKLIKKLFLKLMSKFSQNTAVNILLSNVLTVVVVSAGLFIALGILNLDKTVTSLLAGAGVVGLAIGLAFQDPILNIISGIIMSVREPFKIGDMVETNEYFGTITHVSLRSTTIKVFTGEDVIIPNKMVLQNPIKNYSLTQYRRVDIACGVAYSDDLDVAEQNAIDAIKNDINYDKDKPVEFLYNEFGDSSINFTLRFWLDMVEEKNYLEVKSKAIKALKKAFDNNDINIPFPIRTIEFSQKNELKQILTGNNTTK